MKQYTHTINSIGSYFQGSVKGRFQSGLVAVCLLTLLLMGCATEKAEPVWTDMYEVRSYQVETVTNEIVTTVFISKNVETNQVRALARPVTDFDGYDFEYSEPTSKSVVDSGKPVGDTQIELQCVDGSCGVKKE